MKQTPECTHHPFYLRGFEAFQCGIFLSIIFLHSKPVRTNFINSLHPTYKNRLNANKRKCGKRSTEMETFGYFWKFLFVYRKMIWFMSSSTAVIFN